MSSPSGTQAQRNRTRLLAASVVIVLTAIIAWSLRGTGRADAIDGWWLRARFAWRESVQPAISDADIVLVEIDDRSLARWKEPLFLWGPHLAAAMNHLTASGVRLIALDWIQPQSVDEYFPGHEAPLMQALQRARNVVLVKEFKPDGSEILPAPQLLYSLPNAYQDPQAHLGYAELSNQESIVAAFQPTVVREDQGREVSFAARIVERATQNPAGSAPVPLREDGTVLINYRSRKKGSAFPRYSLYDIALAKTVDKRFKNKIVIIGAAYTGSNDSHYVPILEGVSGARLLPGPELQAHATRTLLSNQPIREPAAAMVALLALLPALLAIPAWLRWSWVGAALASFGIALVWIAAAFLLFSARDFALPIFLPIGCGN